MSQQSVSQKDFIQSRYGDNMQGLLALQDRAKQRYSLYPVRKSSRTTVLKKRRENNDHALNEQISLSPLHKLWTAWRTQ